MLFIDISSWYQVRVFAIIPPPPITPIHLRIWFVCEFRVCFSVDIVFRKCSRSHRCEFNDLSCSAGTEHLWPKHISIFTAMLRMKSDILMVQMAFVALHTEYVDRGILFRIPQHIHTAYCISHKNGWEMRTRAICGRHKIWDGARFSVAYWSKILFVCGLDNILPKLMYKQRQRVHSGIDCVRKSICARCTVYTTQNYVCDILRCTYHTTYHTSNNNATFVFFFFIFKAAANV